ncbi:MAG: hypothetical protein ACE5H7_17865 [Acidiferrobacterales bacterium]
MSLFGRIKKFAKKALRRVVLPALAGGAAGPSVAQATRGFLPVVAPAAGAAARAIPQIGRAAGRVLPGIGTGIATGLGISAITERDMMRPRRRRMNPANVKALNRAVRRVNASLNLLKRVEKLQRRIKPPRRTTPRAPPGHRVALRHDT